MKKLILTGLVLFTFTGLSQAQNKNVFPSDSIKFVKKLNDFMSKTKKKSQVKEIMKPFEKMWEEGEIDRKRRRNIYRQANAIVARRGRAFPHIEMYLKAIMALEENNLSEENYEAWCDYFDIFIEQKKMNTRKLQRFIESSYYLFSENAIYKNTMMKWRSSSPDYKFDLQGEQLRVSIDNVDLKCFAKGDSIVIYNTGGYYFMNNLKFTGKGGLVTWEQVGVGRDTISAQLENYTLNLKKPNFQIDSVKFINTNYFKAPLLGSLYHKVTKIRAGKKASYPQFKSFTSHFEIKDIFKNVDYSGGFVMKGSRFIGSGSKEVPAQLKFYYKDTLTLVASSRLFILQRQQVLSENTVINIKLGKDSIYHPGLMFIFDIPKAKVDLIRDKGGVGRAPYINTYHNIDMKVGQITWDMKKPKLEMFTGTTQSYAYMESFDYYSEEKYLHLQSLDDVNPLAAVRRFVRVNGNAKEFYADEFANYMRMSMPMAHKYLLNLALEGYISYDLDIDHVKVKDKLFHYLLSSVGDKDYDILTFVSTEVEKNGEISFLTKDMKIDGITRIFLSDSQNVVVFPKNGDIVVKKDRDFTFDGRVDAGLFSFYGKNYKFSYKNFKIDLNNVERLQAYVRDEKELDKYGKPVLLPVQTNLHNIKGDLLIDKPFNKSGMKKSTEYPIFNSKKESYAYYEHPDIQGGAYQHDNFYFQVYPYTFDSLDSYHAKDLRFKGYFNSADILPGFESEIALRPDLSLGLVYNSPEAGTPVYKGKANFKGTVDLSNRGLLAEGDLKYIKSTTVSNQIVLLPDQFKAEAQRFDNLKTEGAVEYPWVESLDSRVDWFPYRDSLITQTKEKALKIYDKNTLMTGDLLLQPTGMKGRGHIDLTTAELRSREYLFKANVFDSDTASFNLKSKSEDNIDFITDNVNAHVDFIERKGDFKSNGEASFVKFPSNQYICYMDQFTWYMDKEVVEIKSSGKEIKKVKENEDLGPVLEEDVELSGPQFVSVHPKQDSLNFVALEAVYNNRKKLITAKKVGFIRVADAVIYPGDSTVVVAKNAYMHPLEESKIVANTVTRFHTISNAKTQIYGRRSYGAKGEYEYEMNNGTKEKIFFDDISVDSTMQTVAFGEVKLTDNFTLSPDFAYNGRVELYATKEHLNFKGYTKMKHDCDRSPINWVKFESEINPEEIFIPIDSPLTDMNGTRLRASFMVANDSNQVYPAFLSPHKKYSDGVMLPTRGFLIYDANEKKYIISNKDKLSESSLPGNYLSMHRDICNVYGEGKINLGVDFGRFEISSAGDINQNASGTSTLLNLMMLLKFPFNDKCLNIMAKDLNKSTEGADFSENYFKGITELVGREKSEAYITNISLGNRKKYPKQLEKGILISQVNLTWDPKNHAFNSEGSIGIGNVLKKQVDKSVYGRIQVVKRRRGNHFYMYLELDAENWYFFHMSNSVLKVCSSNKEFNTIIKELKADDRRVKGEKGKKSFSFFLAPPVMKDKFLKQFGTEDDGEDEDDDTEKNAPEENF